MAKIYKTKLKEAEQIVDETIAQEPAVPATTDEVEQALPATNETQPSSQVVEPVSNETIGGLVDTPKDVQVNPETISLEMSIPTDQLAAAVAQATGDVTVAETAPDAVAEQEAQAPAEEPLVEQEDTDVISVENEDGGAVEVGGETETITESTDIHSNPGYKVAKETEEKTLDIIETGVENMAKDAQQDLKQDSKIVESKDVCPDCGKTPCECETKVFTEAKDEIKEAGRDDKEEKEDITEEKFSFDKLEVEDDGDSDLPGGFEDNDDLGDGGMDTSIFDELDGEEETFGALSSKLDDLFGSKEEVAQVADALRTSADVLEKVSGEAKEVNDEEDTLKEDDGDAYLLSSLLDEDEEPLDFDKISDFGYEEDDLDSIYDDDEEEDDDLRDEDYLEESLSRVPCKFPKKSDVINESMKSRVEKIQESDGIIYPAGSEPDFSEPLVRTRDANLVEAHEKAIEARRKAISKFRESIKRENENNNRFREALRSSVRVSGRGYSSNSNSWSNNQFIDKYQESQKLDFSKLFEDGFLG